MSGGQPVVRERAARWRRSASAGRSPDCRRRRRRLPRRRAGGGCGPRASPPASAEPRPRRPTCTGEWSGQGTATRCAGFDRCDGTRTVTLTIDCSGKRCQVTPFDAGYGSPPLRFQDGRYRAAGPVPADVAPRCGGRPPHRSVAARTRRPGRPAAGQLRGVDGAELRLRRHRAGVGPGPRSPLISPEEAVSAGRAGPAAGWVRGWGRRAERRARRSSVVACRSRGEPHPGDMGDDDRHDGQRHDREAVGTRGTAWPAAPRSCGSRSMAAVIAPIPIAAAGTSGKPGQVREGDAAGGADEHGREGRAAAEAAQRERCRRAPCTAPAAAARRRCSWRACVDQARQRVLPGEQHVGAARGRWPRRSRWPGRR